MHGPFVSTKMKNNTSLQKKNKMAQNYNKTTDIKKIISMHLATSFVIHFAKKPIIFQWRPCVVFAVLGF